MPDQQLIPWEGWAALGEVGCQAHADQMDADRRGLSKSAGAQTGCGFINESCRG
jgi:hypothetical protein